MRDFAGVILPLSVGVLRDDNVDISYFDIVDPNCGPDDVCWNPGVLAEIFMVLMLQQRKTIIYMVTGDEGPTKWVAISGFLDSNKGFDL